MYRWYTSDLHMYNVMYTCTLYMYTWTYTAKHKILIVPSNPIVVFPASWISDGAAALLLSNGFPTGLAGNAVPLVVDVFESPNGFNGEGPVDVCGLTGLAVRRSRSTRLALVPRNCASIFGRGCERDIHVHVNVHQMYVYMYMYMHVL